MIIKFSKQHMCQRLTIVEKRDLFTQLYENINGTNISLNARKKLKNVDGLTYGETSIDLFEGLSKTLNVPNNSIYVDLGSGSGKTLVLATLFFPIKQAIGVELLYPLANESYKIAKKFHRITKEKFPKYQSAKLMINQRNILNASYDNADIIYACSTCFTNPIMSHIENMANQLKKGAYLITLKKIKPKKTLDLIGQLSCPMSWTSDASIYIYIKNCSLV